MLNLKGMSHAQGMYSNWIDNDSYIHVKYHLSKTSPSSSLDLSVGLAYGSEAGEMPPPPLPVELPQSEAPVKIRLTSGFASTTSCIKKHAINNRAQDVDC